MSDFKPGDKALIVGHTPKMQGYKYNGTFCVITSGLEPPPDPEFFRSRIGRLPLPVHRCDLHDGNWLRIPPRYLIRLQPDDEAKKLFGDEPVEKGLSALEQALNGEKA